MNLGVETLRNIQLQNQEGFNYWEDQTKTKQNKKQNRKTKSCLLAGPVGNKSNSKTN